MILNVQKEVWDYLEVKKLSVLLHGIKCHKLFILTWNH